MRCFPTVQAEGDALSSASEEPLPRPQLRSRVDRRRGAASPVSSVESTAAEQARRTSSRSRPLQVHRSSVLQVATVNSKEDIL